MNGNILYIIGNGFDIAHGISSKYELFYSYLYVSCYPFLNDLCGVYPQLSDNDKLWGEFEKELSCYYAPIEVVDDSLEQMKTLESYQEGDFDYSIANCFIEGPIKKRSEVTDRLKVYFNSWIKQINISGCKSKCKFGEKSVFLTFNYTRTLEDVYEIKDNKICHIHGKVDDADLIIGHC